MVKTSLRTYRDNIWHFFTILGFVALGVIIGIAVVFPAMKVTTENAVNDISQIGKKITDFSNEKFINSLVDQFKAMNWSNPLKTLQDILTPNKLTEIFGTALHAGGCELEDIKSWLPQITKVSNTLINTSIIEISKFGITIGICSIVGYALIRTHVQMKTIKDYNLFKYIISLVLNVLLFVLYIYVILLASHNLSTIGFYFLLIPIVLIYTIIVLFISFITYGSKDIKIKEIINFKTIIAVLVSDLIVIFISTTIISIINVFSDIAAVLIGIPLMIITTIIIDATTNAHVAEIRRKKNVECISVR